MEGSNYQGDDGYQGEALGQPEGGGYYPDFEPEPAYDPGYAAAAEQQAIDDEQETLATGIVQRHPVLADTDAADRLLTEARGQAERLGVPELATDLRFVSRVADELGDTAFLSPFEQIQAAGSEGLGKHVLDFRHD